MTSNVSLNCLVRNRKLKVKYCYKNSSLFELAYCNTEHVFVFVLSSQEHVKEEKTQERQEAKKVKKREKGEG